MFFGLSDRIVPVRAYTIILLFFIYKETYSIVCYHCDGVNTMDDDCTTLTNCTGKACIIYERPDGVPTSTFCVHEIPKLLEQKLEITKDCWMEPDGKGKHCICGQDFCNRPRSLKSIADDFIALPIENATLIKKNPLIDYEDVWEDDDNGMNAKPPPVNVLFPGAADVDLRIAGEDSKNTDFGEEDLIPIGHENYEYEDEKKTKSSNPVTTTLPKILHHYRRANVVNQDEPEHVSAGQNSIPPVLLIFFSSAATIARLFS